MNHDIGVGGKTLVVSDNCKSCIEFIAKFEEEAMQPCPVLRIKTARRFVGQDYLGRAYYGAGYGHALALSAGKLSGHVAHAVGQTHAVKHLARTGEVCGLCRTLLHAQLRQSAPASLHSQ